MDAADFFRLRYDALHGSMTERLLADLSGEHLRAGPEGRNSIVWNSGMSRVLRTLASTELSTMSAKFSMKADGVAARDQAGVTRVRA